MNGVGVAIDGYENWPNGTNGNNSGGPFPDPSSDFAGVATGFSGGISGNGSCQMTWAQTKDMTGKVTLQNTQNTVLVTVTYVSPGVYSITVNVNSKDYIKNASVNNLNPSVYLGFTGSTGGNTDYHIVNGFSTNYQTTTTTNTNNNAPVSLPCQVNPALACYDSITSLPPVL